MSTSSVAEPDWTCADSECRHLNFARRTQCNKCSRERSVERSNVSSGSSSGTKRKLGTEIGKAAAEKSRGLFSAEDWQCSKCANVNWARRQTCNMCNAPKFCEVEERTGYGGGYNDRGVVEYKERSESDSEYDEFGRLKRKTKSFKTKEFKSKKMHDIGRDNEGEDDEEEDDDDEEEGDLSKYDLWGDEQTTENKNDSPCENNTPKRNSNTNIKKNKHSPSRSPGTFSSSFSTASVTSSSSSCTSTSRSRSSSATSRSRSRSGQNERSLSKEVAPSKVNKSPETRRIRRSSMKRSKTLDRSATQKKKSTSRSRSTSSSSSTSTKKKTRRDSSQKQLRDLQSRNSSHHRH